MNLVWKFVLYIIIVSTDVDYSLARPTAFLRQVKRNERQVVQPTWLSHKDFFFIDPNVHITDENLKETANIRHTIQSAVNAGTFAVDVSKPKAPISVIDSSENAQKSKQPSRESGPNNFDFSQWNFQIFTFDQQNTFSEEMRRAWQEFVENSRKWLTSNGP